MKQEDKELLLQDLCARLPYKTKIQLTEYSDLTGEKLPSKIKTLDYCTLGKAQAYCKGFRKDEIKPYLFPLSSMTEEQKKEYHSIIYRSVELHYHEYCDVIDIDFFDVLQEFYLKNLFDYRELIPKDLALDATGLNIY